MIWIIFKDGSSLQPLGVEKVEILETRGKRYLVITSNVGRRRVNRIPLDRVHELRCS